MGTIGVILVIMVVPIGYVLLDIVFNISQK